MKEWLKIIGMWIGLLAGLAAFGAFCLFYLLHALGSLNH